MIPVVFVMHPDFSVFGELFILLLLLLCSAFVSGAEVAYFSLSPSDLEKMREKKGKSASTALKLLSRPDKLLTTILVTNNMINIAIIILAAFISQKMFDLSDNPVLAFIIEVVVITFILLLFSEIIPKIYASRYQLRFAVSMAKPLSFCEKLFKPLSSLLMLSSFFMKKRSGIHARNISMDDLSDALDLTSVEIKDDKEILRGIVRFGNTSVSAIMCPRIDVTALDIKEGFHQILPKIIESGFSRIPVHSGTFDNVKGILFVKDILAYLDKPDQFRWQSLIRPPYVVPETKKINELLKEFQERKIHIAIVVDEYGGTSGIVTLEDILEEIVGDITDETDEETPLFRLISPGCWIFEGKVLINDFYRITGINEEPFEELKGDSETLAGLLLEMLGEIPQKGRKITIGNYEFTIEAVDKRRIREIRVVKKEE
jgi:putative hemolysin